MSGFWKKMWISAVSGLLGKIIIAICALGISIAGIKVIGIQFDLTKDNYLLRSFVNLSFIAVPFFGIQIFTHLDTILNWLNKRKDTDLKIKESSIRELELKKEILELERKQQNSGSSVGNDGE